MTRSLWNSILEQCFWVTFLFLNRITGAKTAFKICGISLAELNPLDPTRLQCDYDAAVHRAFHKRVRIARSNRQFENRNIRLEIINVALTRIKKESLSSVRALSER